MTKSNIFYSYFLSDEMVIAKWWLPNKDVFIQHSHQKKKKKETLYQESDGPDFFKRLGLKGTFFQLNGT